MDEDFSLLCAALQQTGLDHEFDNKNRLWTLFAPNDGAFEALDKAIADDVFDSAENLEFVLLYHAVRGMDVKSGSLECTQLLQMANLKDTRTVCKGDMIFQNGGGNRDDQRPKIIDADITACNGLIHFVDNVIIPKKLPDANYKKRPTPKPAPRPTPFPTHRKETPYPTPGPSPYPTPYPTLKPSPKETPYPTYRVTYKPTEIPTYRPTSKPTSKPTYRPSPYPTFKPTPFPVEYYPDPEPEPYYPDDHHQDPYYPEEEPYHEDPYHDDPYHHDHSQNDHHHPDHHDDGQFRENPCISIGDILCQAPGFDLFCEAIKIVGLFDFLQVGFEWTVFAPTNEAFETFLNSIPRGTLTPDSMEELILFHMIENAVIEFDDLRCEEWIQMANGRYSYTHCRGFDNKYQVGGGNGFQDNMIMLKDSPMILRKDLIACNGFIHTVDTVLRPS